MATAAENPLQALIGSSHPTDAPCRLAAAFCLIATTARRLNFTFVASAASLVLALIAALLMSETDVRPATSFACEA
jgi:hypothetical protein